MTRFAYALLLVITATAIAGAQQPNASGVRPVAAATPVPIPEKRWEKFSPPDGGFTVLMPGKITSQEQMVEGSGAKTPNRISYADLGRDVFMVTYMQFPDPVTDEATIKLMLDRGRDHGVAASKGTLKSENEITLEGYSGRQWLLSLPNGIKATAKAFWVSDTLYQILVVTDEVQTPTAAKLTDERMTKFFGSFTLSSTGSR